MQSMGSQTVEHDLVTEEQHGIQHNGTDGPICRKGIGDVV